MSIEAEFEALPSDQFRSSLASHVATLVVERQPPEQTVARRASLREGPGSRDVEHADLEVTAGDTRVLAETKKIQMTGAQLLGVLEEAVTRLLGEHSQVLVLHKVDRELASVIEAAVKQVPRVARARRSALSSERIEQLVDHYMAKDPLGAVLADIEDDNAQAQARFLESVPVYPAERVADVAGHASQNRSATATRWKSKGAIFSVRHGGRDLYPAFQFKDGAPHPVIAKVLKALPQTMSPWQIAFWFTSANGWLDGAAPQDRLSDEAALLLAAEREGQEWMG